MLLRCQFGGCSSLIAQSAKVVALLACVAAASVASAQQQVDRSKIFQLKDLDKNESLDKEEFSGGSIGKMRERSDVEFDRKDLDDNNELSLEEFLEAAKWTEEEYQQLRREDFARQDKDGDGEITREQFVGGKDGVNKQYAEEMFAVLDRNKDDVVEEDEFVDREEFWNYPRIQFQYRDGNRDGELTMEEYIANDKGKEWEANRRAMFTVFDVDRDKKLSVDEFEKLESEAIRQRALWKMPEEARLLATYDLDSDKSISPSEMELVLNRQGKPADHAKKLFAALDRDGDKKLDSSEINRLNGKEPAIEFASRDVNGSGTLTLAEQIGDSRGKDYEKWRRLYFQDRDFDGNNQLSLEEYSIPDGDRKILFVKRDANKDGQLTLEEQLAGVVGTKYEEWRRLNFRGHDLDRDGIATREEFVIDDKQRVNIN